MENCVRKFENEKYCLEIIADDRPESPREWDNLGTMVCCHSGYNLGDNYDFYDEYDLIHFIAQDLDVDITTEVYNEEYDEYFDEDRETNDILKDIQDKALILPLYLYDHSGISMRTYPHGYHRAWDCSQVGYIYVSKEDIVKEYGCCDEDTMKKAELVLEGEIEVYSQYLEGEVYGYSLSKKDKCECCNHIEYNEIDSCWGFYGYNLEENGMLENIDLSKDELSELLKCEI